ncbi:MAG: sugar porter family MFS transporter [Legionellaceae bacterium]|nr:sugar porter family MFS transporter [Legionellaceae bacterium]
MIWFIAIMSSVSGFLFGYDEGIIAGSLDLVQSHFQLSEMSLGFMTSSLPFGSLFGSILIGAILASKLVKCLGRLKCIGLAGLLFFVGAVLEALAQHNWQLIVARLILGLAIGSASVITPLYIAETAPAALRGAMVACYQLAITIGIVCAYSVNYLLLEDGSWRLMFASCAIPAVILVIGTLFLPESPQWLISVGRYKSARKILNKLHHIQNTDNHVEVELIMSHKPHENNWRPLFSMPLLPILMFGMTLFCLQQMSGINVIIYYAPILFKGLGFKNGLDQILATMGIGMVNMFATIFAIMYIDTIGRRKLLLFGFVGTTISLAILSCISIYEVSTMAYFAVTCLTIFIISYAISIGPIPYIAMAEVFPLHVRGAGMGMSAMSNWLFNGVMVFTFPLLYSHLGVGVTFLIYAIICFFGLLFTYFFMPETKGLTLEYIEDYVLSGKPIRLLGINK